MRAELYPSPNHGPRRKPISAVVIHYTGSLAMEGVLRHFAQRESGQSAHYVVGRDGRLVQMVEESEAAWHAGRSAMFPREKPPRESNVNDFSIGVELVGTADSGFTDRQLAALYALLERLVATYRIAPERVVGHAHVAPGRKIDPDGFDRQLNWGKVREVCRVALQASARQVP
jgi:N-acetyl-anhydromuramyl-L-alanine amidase AmpD